MGDRVLVIGSNSFSGASFISYLLAQGDLEVAGTSRSAELNHEFLPYQWADHSRFSFYQYDLNSDLESILDLVAEFKPDYVVNFAAQSMVAESWDNPDHWFMTNVVSTVKLHDGLRKFDFIKRYTHITTPEVYGSCQGFVTEDHSYNPSTPYAVSRAAADMSLKSFYSAYEFPFVATRAANVYGPGQQLYRIIPKTILSIKKGVKLPLHGGGYSERSFIHIKDVSEATWKITQQGQSGSFYHISTRRMITIRDLVKMICEKLGVDFNEAVEDSGERLGKDSAYMLDSTKLRTELQWQDHIELEQGISEVVDWVDGNFETLNELPLNYIHKK